MPHASMSLRQAALTTGIGLLLLAVAAPFAEFYVYPRIVDTDPAVTLHNVATQQALFGLGLGAYLSTFVLDIVIAWSIYVLMRPAAPQLARLTAWLRLAYSLIGLTALLHLVSAFRLATDENLAALIGADRLAGEVKYLIKNFRIQWHFGLVIFGAHLCLLGYVIAVSRYIPRLVGAAVAIAGLGYIVNCLRPYFFPTIDTGFVLYAYFGELVFMLWLLVMGWRLNTRD